MTDACYWIWLQTAMGVGSLRTDRMIREGISPEALYQMSPEELAATGLFSKGEARALKALSLEEAQRSVEKARALGCAILTPEHPHYPKNLTHIDRMPCVLYLLGTVASLADQLVLTMVGTRSSTEYGEYATYRLSHDLAAAGCTVVSGLAVGIDRAAHEGALSVGGRTIGFLACGLDVDYPSASRDLKKRILQTGGALISEFPFGMPALPHNFNIRNRLLSGISAGVVVVQAPLVSGALITARHALAQNRDVFAVPGGIFDKNAAGCNRLIRDGAGMVVNAYSILGEYIGRFPTSIDARTVTGKIEAATKQLRRNGVKLPPSFAKKDASPVGDFADKAPQAQPAFAAEQPAAKSADMPAPERRKLAGEALERLSLSASARAIYDALDFAGADCCAIAQQTGLRIMDIMAGLTELELCGLVEPRPGQRYAVSEKGLD